METNQKSASAFGSPEGQFDPNQHQGSEGPEGQGGEGGEGGEGNEPPAGGGNQPPEHKGLDYNALFNKAAEKIGVNAPEKVEEDLDKFIDFVTESAKQNGGEGTQDLHPDAKRFNEALKSGTKPEEFFKEYTEPSAELNLPDDQFMFNYLKNQNGKTEENENGWTDEDIQERVNRMKESGVLETQAFDYKQKRRQEIEQQRAQQQQEAENQQSEQSKTVKDKQEKAFNQLMNEVDKIENIGGVKVAPEEHKEFKEVFSNLLKPVSEDNDVRPLDMLLHNNTELYKMLYMYYQGTEKFNKTLTEAKEEVKNQFIQKLNLNPDVGSGQSREPNTVDVSKFASPEL